MINRIVGRPNDDIIGSIFITRFKRRNFIKTYMKIMDISISDNLSQFGMNSVHNEFLLRV